MGHEDTPRHNPWQFRVLPQVADQGSAGRTRNLMGFTGKAESEGDAFHNRGVLVGGELVQSASAISPADCVANCRAAERLPSNTALDKAARCALATIRA